MAEKARYWVAILYPENMKSDWEDNIGDTIELPFAYCVHDKDLRSDGDADKPHVHFILAFPNTTTKNNALRIFNLLDPTIKLCFPVINIKHKYEYLIHNTEDARKKHKFQYDKSCRITGNNFDIGHYEQVSVDEKHDIRRELADFCIDNCFFNYLDFYRSVCVAWKGNNIYEEVAATYQSFFSAICKGAFLKHKISDKNWITKNEDEAQG